MASRVAKVLLGARRSSNNNTQLVTELKRWNRKLEFENNRLYEIIDKLSSGNASGLTAELNSLQAKSHHKGQESAQLVKRLEDQNRNLQVPLMTFSMMGIRSDRHTCHLHLPGPSWHVPNEHQTRHVPNLFPCLQCQQHCTGYLITETCLQSRVFKG